jgi:phosphatidylserine decarboxylase
MGFAREAWPLVLPPLLIGIGCLWWSCGSNTTWLQILGWFLVALAIAILLFFRDPSRTPPADSVLVVSPADGVVVETTTLESGEKFVAIFLSVLDVHVNRSPYTGTVTKVTEKPGTYLHANSKDATTKNARIDVDIDTAHGPMRFSQVSGLIARKISCRVKPGDKLSTGERFGLIYFGSRMEILMPASAVIKTKVGERAVAGETVIASFAGNSN